MIEACEESGSYDLPYYVDHLKDRIGQPSLVVCLDSGCGDYDRLWLTTSLRGIAAGTLTVRVLTEGVHSGDASGIVPSSFRLTARSCCRASRTRPPARSSCRTSTSRSRRSASSRPSRPPQVLGDTVINQLPLRRRRPSRWPTRRPSWC